MSTDTAMAPASTAALPAHRVTFPRILHSEWIKFWSLRSSAWTVGTTVVVMAAVSWLAVFFTAREATDPDTGPQDAAVLTGLLHDPGIVLTGTELAKLVVAVLGVLIITGEYSTGMVRSTLTAVPRRLPALWAKALVLVGVTAVTVVVAEVLSLAVALPTLRSHDATLALGAAETQRILLGGVLYLAGVALFAFGIGAIVRVSAGAGERARAVAGSRGHVPHAARRLLPPGQPVPAGDRRSPAPGHSRQHRGGTRHQHRCGTGPVGRVLRHGGLGRGRAGRGRRAAAPPRRLTGRSAGPGRDGTATRPLASQARARECRCAQRDPRRRRRHERPGR